MIMMIMILYVKRATSHINELLTCSMNVENVTVSQNDWKAVSGQTKFLDTCPVVPIRYGQHTHWTFSATHGGVGGGGANRKKNKLSLLVEFIGLSGLLVLIFLWQITQLVNIRARM